MSIRVEGWGWPGAARKAHYFLAGDSISLCGKWMFTGPRTVEDGSGPDDCVVCRREMGKRKLVNFPDSVPDV